MKKHYIYPLLLVGLLLTLLVGIPAATPALHAQNATCTPVTQITSAQCEALLAFYQASNGQTWTDLWFNPNAPGGIGYMPCDWPEISCEGDQVISISAANKGITGRLPAQFADLDSLAYLDLSHNALSGPIPAGLTISHSIDLSHNQLIGSIPEEIATWGYNGNYDPGGGGESIDLSSNRLTGAIPGGLDQLNYVGTLDLSGNQLTGEIPPEITQIAGHQCTDFFPVVCFDPIVFVNYNMLTTSDPVVDAFLDDDSPNWRDTQTVPPEDITAEVDPRGILSLSWDTVGYKWDKGHIEIACGTEQNGPYDLFTIQTVNKAVDQIRLSGIPKGTYYCRAATITPKHLVNPSQLSSALSDEFSFTSDGTSKPPNDSISNPTVITDYPFMFYSFDLLNAKVSPDEPRPSCGKVDPQRGGSIFFKLIEGGPGNPNDYGQEAGQWLGSAGFFRFRDTVTPEQLIIAAFKINAADDLEEVDCATFTTNLGTSQGMSFDVPDFQADYIIGIWRTGIAAQLMPITAANDIPAYLQTSDAITFDSLQECSRVTTIPPEECQALLAFYEATGGPGWSVNTLPSPSQWRRYNDPCTWYGVTCTLGRVTGLDLSGSELSGEVPANIDSLRYLTSLDLSDNALTGSIEFITKLENLTSVNLRGNKFSGDIPPSLEIDAIDVRYNMLNVEYDTEPPYAYLDELNPGWDTTQTLIPTDITASAISGNRVRVSWTPIVYTTDSGYYNVGYSTTPGGPYTIAGHTADKTANEFVVTGLAPDTQYYFAVRAVTRSHAQNPNKIITAYSLQVSATTTESVPLTSPADLMATPIADGQVQFNWNDTSVDETHFTVERTFDVNALGDPLFRAAETSAAQTSSPRTVWDQIATLDANTTEYVDNTISPDTPAVYRVRAYRSDDDVYSGYTNMVKATALSPLLIAPAHNETLGTRKYPFRWKVDPLANEYQLMIRSIDGSFKFKQKLKQCAIDCVLVPTYGAIALPNQTELQWRVVSRNKTSGYQHDYGWRSIHTSIPGKAVLYAPAPDTIVKTPTVRFEWSRVDRAASYKLIVKQIGGPFKFRLKVTPTEAGCNDVGTFCSFEPGGGTWTLVHGASYRWRVQSQNLEGSLKSESFKFSTSYIRKPNLVAPDDKAIVNTVTPTLVWKMIPEASQYRVQVLRGKNLILRYKLTATSSPLTIDDICDPLAAACTLNLGDLLPAGLKPGKKYSWQVRTINAYASVKSKKRSFTVDPAASLLGLDIRTP